jgi:hypothetical protein
MKKEEVWDLLAHRPLIDEDTIFEKCKASGQISDFTIADLEQEANKVYLNALDNLNTENMWNIYLDFCMQRLNKNSKYLNEEVGFYRS